MPKIRAFVGRSFHKDDETLVTVFLKHFDTYKKLGFLCEDAEEAESRSVAEKVKAKLVNKQAFIGIYTRKFPLSDHFARHLNPHDFTWYSRFLWRKNNLSAASGWTIQESGYAIGKDMKLIMLVEEGVIDVGGLHGDHEVIPFSRQNPEKCFPLLDAQIINLLAEPEILKDKADAESLPEGPESPESKKERQELKKGEDSERDYFFEILYKLRHEKDPDGAKQLQDEWLRSAETDYERVKRQAIYESLRFGAGDSDAFQELERLVKQNPEHPSPLAALGRKLRDLRQFSTAADRLKEASERAKDLVFRNILLVEAAVCLTQDNKHGEAIELLGKALVASKGETEAEFEVYKGLVQVAEIAKDDDKRVALLEKALSLRPAEHALRFQIALAYSKMEKHALALYHYKILTDAASNGSNLNNLGVVYSNLGLPCKSVAAYKRSGELNETLAMANLAYKFIGEGFLDEASGLVEKAMSVKDFHQNVASARARIDEVKKEEDDREQEILKNIEDERKFRLAFADAAYPISEATPSFAGKWRTPHGEIDIETNGNVLTGKGISREIESGLRLSNILLGGSTAETPRQITKTILLNATVQGATGSGSMTVETERGSILGSTKLGMKVQLIVSRSDIWVLQIDEKGAISFARFTRLVE